MKFLDYAYKELDKLNYFNDNVNIILTYGDKTVRRNVENLICCVPKYKAFVKAYIDLKDKILKDSDFREEYYKIIRDMSYNNGKYQSINGDSFYYIFVILFSLLIENDYLVLKKSKTKNIFTKLITVLMDRTLSETKTISKCLELLKIEPVGEFKIKKLMPKLELESFSDIDAILCYLNLFTNSMCHTVLFKDDEVTDALVIAIQKLHQSTIEARKENDEYIDSLVKRSDPVRVTSLLSKLSDAEKPCAIVRDLHIGRPIDEIVSRSIFGGEINRKGYLKREFCSGNLPKSSFFRYQIREIVSQDGICIYYHVYSNEFTANIIEDYVDGICRQCFTVRDKGLHKHDDSFSESILLLSDAVLSEVRQMYIGYIADIEKVTNEIPNSSVSESASDDSLYTKKEIFIAPYKRKLPKNAQRNSQAEALALKFNYILEDDETFVDSFRRKQRIRRDSTYSESIILQAE